MSLDLQVNYLFDLSRYYSQRKFCKFSSDTKFALELYE